MVNQKDLRPQDLGKSCEQLIQLNKVMPLSFPYDKPGMEPDFPSAKPEWKEKYCTSLDGCV
ncbi:MAG TPA: (Fe-S)-binding protein, partial [Syntrophomonas sp.]|nr:(Fe-S)-binding protein [Syntrophomonas sp.]